MAEDEIAALKEAQCNQLLLMKRLYTELEEEREASASGADEALKMILRLQKEKAEEKMEACQYKQMTEAKMFHSEESLAMLEKVILEKDIEIDSLKHQVKTFKQMLLSSGIHQNRRFSRGGFIERTSSCVQIRRQNSMPSVRFSGKLCSEITVRDEDGSLIPQLESFWKGIGEYQNQLHEESNLDENRVQEVVENDGCVTISSNYQFPGFDESTTCSCHSCLESELIGSTIQYVSTQQTLEIPKRNNGFLIRKSSKKVIQESCFEDEHESMHFSEKTLKLDTLREEDSMNYQPKFSLQNDVEELKYQIQQLSNDVRIMKQEDSMKGKEQVELLRMIHEQLNTVHTDIKRSKCNKSSPQDEAMFVMLTEAMLSFSI